MQINISGRHVDITDGIREAVDHSFAKVQNHFPHLDALSIILTVEKHEQKVEAQTQFLGAAVSVHAANKDLYVAIGNTAKKLESALGHRKGAVKSSIHEKPNEI
ncbi:putative sigma-54 modulation protein [Alteromonadaceae bacterium 2753L.S.0a.02]|nr:putative sigma-54 modulation protein [Alteromonadaceae bacterium 2753L.S.0a.02]